MTPTPALPLSPDMQTSAFSLEQRLERLIDGYVKAEATRPSDALAYSRPHADRLFRSRFGEPPAQFRRRVMLERAAERLLLTEEPVWRVALEAGYAATESFLRAFQRAFKVTPGRFRALGKPDTWLYSPSSLHYWRGAIVSAVSKGGTNMNLSDRLIEHDLWLTSQLLEHAGKLTDEQLDAPFGEAVQLVCWENDANLRDLLHNLVLTKEAWVSAIYHRQWSPSEEKALPAMVDRWKAVEGDYRQLAKDVQESNRWDDLFVDALCTPPVTFSFGSVFAHILTHGATRKAIALRELRKHGIEDLGFGEPIEWEREMAKA